MNHVPKAFAALRARQAEEAKQNTARAEIERAVQEREETTLLDRIFRALTPYHNSNLDGHQITILPRVDKKIDVAFDGYTWLTFSIERHYSRCSCENVCDCETSTWITMAVTQHRRKNDYRCYFGCYESDLNNEDSFAVAMSKMLDDFVNHQKYPSLYS